MNVDLNRENRIHVHNVRFDSSKKKYIVTLKEPINENKFDLFDVDRDVWITFGGWEQRKRENNYY